MEVKFIEITKQEYEKIDKDNSTYFINGCLFTRGKDNLIAFPIYESATLEPSKYFRIEVNL